jgi:hypothetical protein
MADEALVSESTHVCRYCDDPIQSDEMAVFRDGAKVAHLKCWRLPRRERAPHEDAVAPADPAAAPSEVSA